MGGEDAGSTAPNAAARIALRIEDRIGSALFERHFGSGRNLRVVGDQLQVDAPSGFAASLLERRFKSMLVETACEETGLSRIDVKFMVAGSADATTAPVAYNTSESHSRQAPEPRAARQPRITSESGIDARFALDAFVAGASNRFALDAVTRLADRSVKSGITILTVIGPCGVGKTHLLHAAASMVRGADRAAHVKITSGEAFTGVFVSAINSGGPGAPRGSATATRKIEVMRREHRGVDLLCIDDLGAIADKPATLNELLHTLDVVTARGGRIIVTLSEHPRRLKGLGEALTSRLLGGLVAEIQPPEKELRQRIARSIALRHGLALDEAASAYVADAGKGSVREMEGMILKVEAVRRLLGSMGAPAPHNRVGIVAVQRALEAASGRTGRTGEVPDSADALPGGVKRPVRFERILSLVCAEVGVPVDDVMGSGRQVPVVLARSLCGYVARRVTKLSFPEIARELGRSNHSTVITACQRVERSIAAEETVSLGRDRGTASVAAVAERLTAMLRA